MTPLPTIMVAPNGARHSKADHPALPVTISETVETAKACFLAGAGGVHAHVRDRSGKHTLSIGLYRELLSEMARAVPDVLVQITTESVGQYSPAEQRALVAAVRPRAVSVALREMLSEGKTPNVRQFYSEAAEAGTSVQHILYDTADVAKLGALIDDGFLHAQPMQVLLVLGRYSGRKVAHACDLQEPLAMLDKLECQPNWAVCAFGPHETACLSAALAAGGKVRVGFENNFLNADGTVARDNAARVAEIAAL